MMAGILALANYSFNERNRDNYTYIYELGPSNGEISFSSFFSFYLILNSFIPLELPIVIEIAKFLTTMFM